MTAVEYFNGRYWVINTPFGEVAGRTLEQAQSTAKRIINGSVVFDMDGIGIRIPDLGCLCYDCYDH
jgi:hypothetical protein